MQCRWHLKDTRWPDDSPVVTTHSLTVDINEDEFCMIDYTVNAADGYKHEWNEENVQAVIDFCKRILTAMDVKGNLTIKGVDFPKTAFIV